MSGPCRFPSGTARSGGPDHEVEDADLGEHVRALCEVAPELAEASTVSIQIALVPPDEADGDLSERPGPRPVGIAPCQVLLHDAVEDRDQRRPLLVERLGGLRE